MRGLVAVAVLVAACGGREATLCNWSAFPETGCPPYTGTVCDDPARVLTNAPNPAKGTQTCLTPCEREYRDDGTCALPTCAVLPGREPRNGGGYGGVHGPNGACDLPLTLVERECSGFVMERNGLPIRGTHGAADVCATWKANPPGSAYWPHAF